MTELKKAVPEDAETIHNLAEKIWWPTYTEILGEEQLRYMLEKIYNIEMLRLLIKNEEQFFLLLMEDGHAVGFTAYGPKPGNPEIYRLYKLYLLPEMQGNGYGKMLLKTVFAKVEEAGKHILELNVHRQNKTRFLYEKMGFEITETLDIPFGPYFLNDYIMQKQL